MTGRSAVFVDRDGVVNALAPDPESGLPESPLDTDQVIVLDGVADALKRIREAGFLLVLVTNQPGAAKAKTTVSMLEAINHSILEQLARSGARFDAVKMCLHHPEAVVPELRGPCPCRKPEPGMLLEAAGELDIDLSSSWMVGDSDSDVEAGRRAGVRTILVEHESSAHRRRAAEPDHRVGDLTEAVTVLLDSGDGCYDRRSS